MAEKNVEIIQLKSFVDERGSLQPFEYQSNCPFEIKRVFIISDVPSDLKRGKHKNIVSKHLLVCIKGSCSIKCLEDGFETIYNLDSSEKGLFINSGVYKEMYSFSKDAILLCLSDTLYNPDEYVEKE